MKNITNIKVLQETIKGIDYKYMHLIKQNEISENEICGVLPVAIMRLHNNDIDFICVNNKHIFKRDSFLFKSSKRVNQSKELKNIHLAYEGIDVNDFDKFIKSKK